jgi:formate hydrogenlyase subunit 5
MQMVYAWYPEARRVELRYVVTEPHQHAFGIWVWEPQSGVPSLASVWPLMGWHEREVTDLFGVQFLDHPQPQRLVLHEGVNPVRPPFDPDYPPGATLQAEPVKQSIPEIAGAEADVQLLPFGPVRADVVDAAASSA